MGREFSTVSGGRRFAIYSVGMATCVGFTLLAMFGALDDAIDMRMYRNCLKVHPTESMACLTEERALRLGFYVP
jgi:hypothetical protein